MPIPRTSPEAIHERRWQILGVLILSLLVVVLDTSILNVALKTLAEPAPKGLGASQSQLEWATNSYTLAFAGLLFTWGILGDRLGRKRILLGGMLAFGLSSVLCAFAASPDELIAFRALMGISGAAVLPSTLSIISNVFDPAERAKAIGIWAGAVGLAIAIGPVTGGLLLAHFWWGSVFFVNVPIVAIAIALMTRLVPDSRNPEPGRLDPVGVLLSIAGISVIVFGIIRGGDVGWGAPSALAPLAGGVALLGAFIAWERRFPSPILDIGLFRSRRFSGAVGIILLIFCGYMGLLFAVSFYFQAARDYTPLHTGALLLPLAAGQMIFASQSSRLIDRFGPRALVSTGMALMVVTYLYYTQAGAHSPLLPLELILFLQGVAVGITMPPVTTAVVASVPRQKAGAASAINNTSRQVGGALGVAVLGAIVSSAYRAGIRPHLTSVLGHHQHALDTASSSIAATLSFAAHAGQVGHALVAPAVASYIHAMHEAAIAAVAIGAIGVIVAATLLPRRAPAPAPAAAPPAPAEALEPAVSR
ncbi:MAG: MFS transporter [Conexibacteraceae bacterium]|nr:MFS transporter [Conexibacteraceae bacterium]